MKVRWSVRALRDVEDIYHHVAADKPEAARHLAEKLVLAGDELAHHPFLGRPGRPGLRELIVGNYLIVYRVLEDFSPTTGHRTPPPVEIVTVVHGARRRRK